MLLGNDHSWRKWFAWRPAFVGWGEYAWLETIERRWMLSGGYEYRRLGTR